MTEPTAEPQHDLDADRMVETTETLRDDDPEVMPMDRGQEPGEGPAAADRFGTTHAEEAQGEDLDHRLAQEEPDVGAEAAGRPFDSLGEDVAEEDLSPDSADDAGVGRIVEPDEGVRTDTEKDVVGSDVGRDGGDLTAEESAMHVEPE